MNSNEIDKTVVIMKKLVFIMGGMGNPNNIKRIEEAIARGLDVDVYAFEGQRDGPKDPDGVEVHMLPGYTSDLPYWKRIGKVVNGLKSVISRYKKDECVYYLFRNDKAIIFTLLCNRPYIFEEADMTHANLGNALLRNTIEIWLRNVIRKSVVSVFRSEGFLRYHFGDSHPDNVFVIPNRLHAGILDISQVEYTGLDENHLRFGFVGGVRYDTVYKFAETMLKNFPQHEFHFYGMFPNEKQKKQFMPLDKYENCYFHGAFRSPDELPEIYSKIDVLISAYDVTSINPRYAEPNKLYEAIYFDKPIIVSSNSFLAEKVKNLGVGYDVDALDEGAIVSLINSINAESITEKKENIAKIDKKTCINNNEEFFEMIKEKLSSDI